MKKIAIKIFICSLIAGALLAVAPAAAEINISLTTPLLPGETRLPSLPQYIATLYRFSLLLGGLVAIGSIVLGGIEYTASESITSKEDAKERIRQAIYGLILLASAFLILNTISPGLTSLKGPQQFLKELRQRAEITKQQAAAGSQAALAEARKAAQARNREANKQRLERAAAAKKVQDLENSFAEANKKYQKNPSDLNLLFYTKAGVALFESKIDLINKEVVKINSDIETTGRARANLLDAEGNIKPEYVSTYNSFFDQDIALKKKLAAKEEEFKQLQHQVEVGNKNIQDLEAKLQTQL